VSRHASPFHCPYCGDQDLYPREDGPDGPAGGWECRACLRAFAVTFLGQVPRPVGVGAGVTSPVDSPVDGGAS
jgi:hypothetical protein